MERLTERGHEFTSDQIFRDIDKWSIAQCLNKLSMYENLEDRIVREYDSNVTAYDIIDMFLKNTEEQDKEPLKGFRLLTNDDALLYDQWKINRSAETKGFMPEKTAEYGQYSGKCHCGRRVFDCNKFCSDCGTKLVWD